MRVEGSIEINRSLQEVFGYVSDVDHYPEWMAHVLEVLKDTPGRPQQTAKQVGQNPGRPSDGCGSMLNQIGRGSAG